MAVDDRIVALNDKVASAAEAWLSDPGDVRAYGRLVTAVRERRAYLQPTLDVMPDDPDTLPRLVPPAPAVEVEDTPVVGPPAPEQPDELLDELADQRPVQRLGIALAGHQDPRQVLARLRGPTTTSHAANRPDDDRC